MGGRNWRDGCTRSVRFVKGSGVVHAHGVDRR